MPKAFRHMGVLMMLAVVALGLVGAAYTLWYENLKINATVSTGTVDVQWSTEPYHADDGRAIDPTATSDETVIVLDANGNPVRDPYHLNIDEAGKPDASKFIQNCSIGVGGTGDTLEEPANPSQHTLVINATGLYPYAGCEFAFNIENNGTVPVHLTQKVASTLTQTPAGSVVKFNVNWLEAQSATLPPAEAAAVCNDIVDMWTKAPALLGGPLTWKANDAAAPQVIQLHSGDKVVCKVSLYLDQSSTESANLQIISTLTAHQWNETAASVP